VAWSPDSRYLAIPGYESSRGEDVFALLDVLTQQKVGQVYAGIDMSGDVVWLDHPLGRFNGVD
jgi:hypothetical protein